MEEIGELTSSEDTAPAFRSVSAFDCVVLAGAAVNLAVVVMLVVYWFAH